MTWCGVYQDNDAEDAITLARISGEKNVAMRIVRLIGLKPENAPVDAWENADILDRMLRVGDGKRG